MPIKLVILKPGLDSHYRGALMVARHLASRGMEVVFLGNQQPGTAVRAALQEDADVLGISSLSGNHRTTVPAIMDELRRLGGEDMVVVLGGIIPEVDRPALFGAGVHGIYGPGTPLSFIADEIVAAVQERDALAHAAGGALAGRVTVSRAMPAPFRRQPRQSTVAYAGASPALGNESSKPRRV